MRSEPWQNLEASSEEICRTKSFSQDCHALHKDWHSLWFISAVPFFCPHFPSVSSQSIWYTPNCMWSGDRWSSFSGISSWNVSCLCIYTMSKKSCIAAWAILFSVFILRVSAKTHSFNHEKVHPSVSSIQPYSDLLFSNNMQQHEKLKEVVTWALEGFLVNGYKTTQEHGYNSAKPPTTRVYGSAS